tara:strand:- start:192 stop:521 length:330 start_codon:yes stop_codon:yes gene_type:complete
MTNTLAKVGRSFVLGNKKAVVATCNITSYTSGGEVVNAAPLGFSGVDSVVITGNEKNATYLVAAEISAAAGAYASATTFQIAAIDLDGTNDDATATDDVGMVRLLILGS